MKEAGQPLISRNWTELIRPRRMEVDESSTYPFLWKIRLRAPGTGVRHHSREFFAAGHSLVFTGSGHNQRESGWRASRIFNYTRSERRRH